MKIISKYKDYYDYLTGIYGVDPKLVLDRRDTHKFSPLPNVIYILIIGDTCVEFFYNENEFYFLDEGKEKFSTEPHYSKSEHIWITFPNERSATIIRTTPYKDVKQLAKKENCPILIYRAFRYSSQLDLIAKFPKLDDIGFARIMDSVKIYWLITNWLSERVSELETSIPMTDTQKIEAKGFDKKTSFRPNLKT